MIGDDLRDMEEYRFVVAAHDCRALAAIQQIKAQG
jgi:hypothetical protein